MSNVLRYMKVDFPLRNEKTSGMFLSFAPKITYNCLNGDGHDLKVPSDKIVSEDAKKWRALDVAIIAIPFSRSFFSRNLFLENVNFHLSGILNLHNDWEFAEVFLLGHGKVLIEHCGIVELLRLFFPKYNHRRF